MERRSFLARVAGAVGLGLVNDLGGHLLRKEGPVCYHCSERPAVGRCAYGRCDGHLCAECTKPGGLCPTCLTAGPPPIKLVQTNGWTRGEPLFLTTGCCSATMKTTESTPVKLSPAFDWESFHKNYVDPDA